MQNWIRAKPYFAILSTEQQYCVLQVQKLGEQILKWHEKYRTSGSDSLDLSTCTLYIK